jgi:hypothetical protein
MYTQKNRQTDQSGQNTKAELGKKLYTVYRPVYMSIGIMATPGTVIKCTEIEAMCVNTMQPMTLRQNKE